MEQLTSSRKSSLREAGVFPYSKDFTNFFVFLGVIVGFYFLKLDFRSNFLFSDVLELSIFLPLGAALGALLSTLLQSRFLIGFTSSRRGSVEKSAASLLSTYVFTSLKSIIVVGASYLAFIQLHETLILSKESNTIEIYSFIEFAVKLFGVVLFLFSLLGFFISRMQFAGDYQMSREEILAESREGEMRPEVRAATDRLLGGE